MTVDSIEALREAMVEGIARAFKKRVSPMVKEKLQQSALDNVVGRYSRSSGGIADIANIVDQIDISGAGVTLAVRDEAKPQPSVFGTPFEGGETTFSEWIERGQWMDLNQYIHSGVKAKRPARPFVEPVEQQLLTSGEVESAIRQELN